MQFTANGKGEIVLHKCCTQHGKLTCTVMTVILKMMGRKYRAYMSKRAPRAADSSPRMRQACLETADRLQHASNNNKDNNDDNNNDNINNSNNYSRAFQLMMR